MLAPVSLLRHVMIHVKCQQDFLYGLTKQIRAIVTQNSLSDSWAADEVCAFGERGRSCSCWAAERRVETETETAYIHVYYVKAKV